MVKDQVKMRFDEDFAELSRPDGLLSAANRRMLFVHWLSENWTYVTENRQEQITKAFQKCEMLNAIDGSEEKLIKVQGYNKPYSMHAGSKRRRAWPRR